MTPRTAAVLFALAALSGGCKKDQAPHSAADDAATAQQLFANRCAPCHGAGGAGDGVAAGGLVPRPRDLSDPAWQSSVTDEQIEKIVVFGGLAVGKSPAMPPSPDLDGKEGVVRALRALLRGLKK